jgi:carboxylesterase
MDEKTTKDEFYYEGTGTGVLLIHGLSGSPSDMVGLGDFLHEKGYGVLGIRLPGHGTDPHDMKGVTYQDWQNHVAESLHKLKAKYEKVIIVGYSLGSLLGIIAAADEKADKLVVVSPPLMEHNWKEKILPIAKYVIPWYQIKGGTDPNSIKGPYKIQSYDKIPTSSLVDFFKMINLAEEKAGEITIPTLLLQGDKDGIIPKDSSDKLRKLLKHTQAIMKSFSNSGHALLLDMQRDEVWNDIFNFMVSGNV